MLKYMDYAYAVWKEKSFTKAAKKLYISQPALSLTIKKLEKELGFPIFDRSGKEVALTPMGEKYMGAVGEILRIRTDLEHEVDDLLHLRKGRITVGSTTFVASYILPEMLKRFQKSYPEVKFDILVEPSVVLAQKLESGLADLILDNAAVKDPGYEYLPFSTERILLGVPAEWPINEKLRQYQIPANLIEDPECDYAALPKTDMREFGDEPFILLHSGNKMRQIAHKIFEESHISPEVCFEFDQLMTAVSYAESGFGACFLTDTILRCGKGCRNLTYYLPQTAFPDRMLYIIHKKSRYLSFAAAEFIRMLQK